MTIRVRQAEDLYEQKKQRSKGKYIYIKVKTLLRVVEGVKDQSVSVQSNSRLKSTKAQ